MTNLNGIYGSVGSGKNILEVADCCATPKEIPIYTNFKLSLKNAELIEPEELFDTFTEEKEVPIKKLVTDEAVTWLESRGSGFSDLNKYISYMISQSRKRGLNWTVLSQLRGMLDLRWRGQETQITYCYPRNLDMAGNSTDDFKFAVMRDTRIVKLEMKYETAKQFFGLYDTSQTLMPPDFNELAMKIKFEKNPKLLDEYATKYAKLLIKSGVPTKTQKNGEKKILINDDWIRDKLLEINKIEAMNYIKYIKPRIKKLMGVFNSETD